MLDFHQCPRCDKPLPSWAAYCRRCGLPLPQVERAVVVAHGASPPAGRLLGIVLVGVCLISMAALNSRSSDGPPRSGGYRGHGGGGAGSGGGGGPVTFPLIPFGPTVQTPAGWPPVYEPPQPGRIYRPEYNSTRSRYVTPYQAPYGSPYGNPYGGQNGNPYVTPPGAGAPRGPGR